MPCVTDALFDDEVLPPIVEPLMLAVPPSPPLPPLPVPMFVPPPACGEDDEPDTALPLRASVAVGSDVELELPFAAPPVLDELFETLLLPVALPVPPPVVLPVLLPLSPVVLPALPEVGLAVDDVLFPPVELDEDGDAVDDEVEAPVVCGEPEPVAVELDVPVAVPPPARATLEFEPSPPLPAAFRTVVRFSAVLVCSSSLLTAA